MLMVRAGSPAASRRLSATLLLDRAPIVVLVEPPPLGSARGRGRHPDHRRHQKRPSRSVHASRSPVSRPFVAEEQDDFGRLLDEMDGILEEPTIALLIRLGWLAPGRQKDHASVVHGLCRFVGHVLAMTRNARP